MIENRIQEIIRFITLNIGLENEDKKRNAERELKSLITSYFRHSNPKSKEETIEFQKQIKKLQEIRKIYQKGKPFVKNSEKGVKKGSPYQIFSLLKYYLKEGNQSKAIEESKEHLAYIKSTKSKRTYYRHLKKIRKLGLKI
ncbi:MAG: hypothetical protein R6U96_13100 [Promethearchaeia archaeon]